MHSVRNLIFLLKLMDNLLKRECLSDNSLNICLCISIEPSMTDKNNRPWKMSKILHSILFSILIDTFKNIKKNEIKKMKRSVNWLIQETRLKINLVTSISFIKKWQIVTHMQINLMDGKINFQAMSNLNNKKPL